MEPVTIGGWVFDRVHYNDEGDVLSLGIGDPRPSIDEDTPEGHMLRFDATTGEFLGVTLIGARGIIQQGGRLQVTMPERRDLTETVAATIMASAA